MPYNYIIDWSIRKDLYLNLKNSIVIFDEAHYSLGSTGFDAFDPRLLIVLG